MATVAIDARDAYGTELRGWGRYTRELVGAFEAQAPQDLDLRVIRDGGRGPEVLFEQVALPIVLRRIRPDVVHAPNCFLPLWRPCPGVVTIHDLAFEVYRDDFSARTGLKYRLITPRAARSAQLVICPSEFTRADICERYGVDPARTRLVTYAPALPVTDSRPPEGRYILAVGDLRHKKNLVRLVQAFAALRREGQPHRLVLAGLDSGAGAAIEEAAAGEPVQLTGYVSDAELDALMRGAELLVHPSLYEGFGLVVLEAMTRGCPVAVANATALPETAGGAAELFDPLDVDDIAAAMTRALTDRDRLAAAGKQRADDFSWQRTADLTAAVYRELA